MTAQEIIHALNEKGISCYRIAKDLGFSKGAVSYWARGINTPTRHNLKTLKEYAEGKI